MASFKLYLLTRALHYIQAIHIYLHHKRVVIIEAELSKLETIDKIK